MSETYCGKTCEGCKHKESLNCPGCKAGPGRQHSGDCELAQCCRSKGHERCETCGFNINCGTLRGRESVPEHRRWKIEADAEWKERLTRRAKILGKWLWLLFWLVIPSTVAGVLTNETVVERIPSFYVPGQIFSTLCSLAYGAILLKLSSVEEGYKKAGSCYIVVAALEAVAVWVSSMNSEGSWTLIITLPSSIIALIAFYLETNAHADVLSGIDDVLSDKWHSLWRWYIGMLGTILGSIVVAIISPILGALVMLAATIGAFVVSITKLVYLYRTARLCREYPMEQA